MANSKSHSILETQRLSLREFKTSDSDFIIKLLNTPKWLEFIGDKNVKSTEDAIEYLQNGPFKSYSENGFGLWLVALKESELAIGMCGLIKRENLENVDIGFAFLPNFTKQGYALEIASATLDYAKHSLKIKDIVAITDSKNIASIRLLDKIGLSFEKSIQSQNKENLLLLSSTKNVADQTALDKITSHFYSLFSNVDGEIPKLDLINDMFIPKGMIINTTTDNQEIYDLQSFIKPRALWLTNGELTNFNEKEIYAKTQIHASLAQRLSLYEKKGSRNGMEFIIRGVKTFQYIKQNGEWKISSLLWCDE